MTATEYRRENNKLLTEYENNVRSWLNNELSDLINKEKKTLI